MPSSTRVSRLVVPTAAVAAVLAVLLVGPCGVLTAYAAGSLSAFGQEYRGIMESAGEGFGVLYRDMTAPPTSYQWECTKDPSSLYSVAYASLTEPYTVSIVASQLTVTRAASTTGVSYSLMGIACTYDANCGDVKRGSTLTFPLEEKRIIIVTGSITSNGVVNFLPMSYYVVQTASACSTANIANVTSPFSGGASPVWMQLWQ
ncbi:hypothetical protein, unknown function [Leishmania tarentolae]|uniref:Uncharacterized protein n=1 Tax=Leishmania tarentolae TaxID=5689 RepID=A0A640KHC3_LEITA|nr:hypothetical protein, unknown function [Leishmania tarentolae]